MPLSRHYRAAPVHLDLGDGFHDVVDAAHFPTSVLRFRHQAAAETVGLGGLTPDEWADHFCRLAPLPLNLPVPLALRYHGHQFGHYNPWLGDGRGFLLAQLREAGTGRVLDLGTKGSGQTRWSRGGDGRLTLQGGVREVLAAEQLQALGVPTCRILSLFETGESLIRHDEPSPTRSGVLVRLQHSHIRFGTFQRLAHLSDAGRMARLVAHVLDVHYNMEYTGDPAAALLRAVCHRAAWTVGAQMAAGFVHGVLNTDNMNITGESFDYGPWRFVADLEPGFVAAYFDAGGLYAFGRQPAAVRWNLERLADALSLVADRAALGAALVDYDQTWTAAHRVHTLWRLGLRPADPDTDQALVDKLVELCTRYRIPVHRLVFDWHGGQAAGDRPDGSPFRRIYRTRWFASLRERLVSRPPAVPGSANHPHFQVGGPQGMLIDEVRGIWKAIADDDDWGPFKAKIAAVRQMGDALGPAPPRPPAA